MTNVKRKRTIPWLGGLTVILGLAGLGALLTTVIDRSDAWADELDQLPHATVQRTDLTVTLRAGGKTDSTQKTAIECQLDRIRDRSADGQRIRGGGHSTITWLIPEGTEVKKDEVLATLDGSEYEEMVRQQAITVDTSQADHDKAQYDLQEAQVALKEYVHGLRIQQYKEFDGQIALAESDVERQRDRVDWSERMFGLGYVALSAFNTERDLLARYEIELDRVKSEFESYKRYTEVKMTQTLETEVDNQLSTFIYQQRRLEQAKERLEFYQEQVAACTIRAPHDGFVIYATERDEKIDLGMEVRRRMKLFYLPNLEKMEVHAMLNETVMRRVEPGMRARVRVEALSDQTYTGQVVSIANVVYTDRNSRMKDDVKNFVARIRLDDAPGLLPEMNAEIEILTAEASDTLVIPNEALTFEDGQGVCYVATAQGLERRPVSTGIGSLYALEVLEGLEEGEEVILNPSRLALRQFPIMEASSKTEPVQFADESSTLSFLQ